MWQILELIQSKTAQGSLPTARSTAEGQRSTSAPHTAVWLESQWLHTSVPGNLQMTAQVFGSPPRQPVGDPGLVSG